MDEGAEGEFARRGAESFHEEAPHHRLFCGVLDRRVGVTQRMNTWQDKRDACDSWACAVCMDTLIYTSMPTGKRQRWLAIDEGNVTRHYAYVEHSLCVHEVGQRVLSRPSTSMLGMTAAGCRIGV